MLHRFVMTYSIQERAGFSSFLVRLNIRALYSVCSYATLRKQQFALIRVTFSSA